MQLNKMAFWVMFINGTILITLGLYGYLIPSGSPTALISSAIGTALFALSFGIKKGSALISHIGISLSLLSTIIFYVVGFLRNNSVILLMAVITSLAVIYYVFDFFARKRIREEENLLDNDIM